MAERRGLMPLAQRGAAIMPRMRSLADAVNSACSGGFLHARSAGHYAGA